jgi:hypothetical protein
MKAFISITGQISGNRTLLNSIPSNGSQTTSLPFNGFKINFSTKKDAKKALWEAYKSLRSDKEDARKSLLSYSKDGFLNYDASTAKIIDGKE